MGGRLEIRRIPYKSFYTAGVGEVFERRLLASADDRWRSLNHPGTTPGIANGSPYLSPPNNATDLEQRRRAWWLCVALDRIVSVGGWPHSVDEKDIGTELPLRRTDFEADVSSMLDQDLSFPVLTCAFHTHSEVSLPTPKTLALKAYSLDIFQRTRTRLFCSSKHACSSGA